MQDTQSANERLVRINESLRQEIEQMKTERDAVRKRFGVARLEGQQMMDMVERYARTLVHQIRVDELRIIFDEGAFAFRGRMNQIVSHVALTPSNIHGVVISTLPGRP